MPLNNIIKKAEALFSLEKNIKVEPLLEAQRHAALNQSKRLEAVAQALLNKPSRSSIKTLAEEVFAIRSEILNSCENLLLRLKPALTVEQFLTYQSQLRELQAKTLQPTTQPSEQTSSDESSPELIPLKTSENIQLNSEPPQNKETDNYNQNDNPNEPPSPSARPHYVETKKNQAKIKTALQTARQSL